MKLIKLSPSSINLMIECPRCFWLKLVKGIKRPDTIFPSLPSGMDKVLKEHFDRFMEKEELPPELRNHEHTKDCKLFNDKEKLEIWRNNFKGVQYTDPETGVILRGAVDNILVKGSKLVVLDYKTRGYPLKEDTHKHYQVQMDIYNFLLRKNGHETEDYTFLLFYHPDTVTETGDFKFNVDLVKIETSAENGEKVFKKAISIINGEMPEPGEGCGFCEMRGQKLKYDCLIT